MNGKNEKRQARPTPGRPRPVARKTGILPERPSPTDKTAQLETVSRELEAFARLISHELHAPLRAVDGYARMLGEDYGEKLDDEGRRILHGIRGGTQRMSRLITGLLTYSRMGWKEIAPERIDLGILVREVFDEVRKGDKKRLIRFAAGPLPAVRGDRAMIREALSHLLSNALKFSRPRGRAAIEVNAKTGAEEVRITVTDNGIGFDAAYADKLFGVFQRLHGEDEFEGTGIGLALVRRIVERHGGRVWAESRPGEGATFGFSLPASPRPAGKGIPDP
jgi:light-regulated signal transduction histidine kinase (bacteriophytochrome)